MSDPSDPTAPDFYSRLGVARSADEQDVKSAAQEAQKRYHPDHNTDPDSRTQFQRVREATECLTDTDNRAAYDVFYERFGPEKATEAYDRWTSFGRTRPAESFSPGFASTKRRSSATDHSDTSASAGSSKQEHYRSGHRNTADQSENRRTRAGQSSTTEDRNDRSDSSTRSSSTDESWDTDSSASENGTSTNGSSSGNGDSHRTHSNFEHRTSYERKEYGAPLWGSLRAWPRVEGGQVAHEIGALVLLGITSAVGLLLTAALGFVLLFAVYVVGSIVAVFEFFLRQAGIARFDSYTAAEIVLTWILEIGVYVGVLFVAVVLFEVLFDRDWDDHLGNRLGFPLLILVFPISLAVGGSLWIGTSELLSSVTPVIKPRPGFVLIGAMWPALHRSTRLLLEAPPNHSGESIVDTATTALFYLGSGSFLLAAYLLGGRWILGSESNPLEYTFLLQHLSPRLLVGVAFCVIVVSTVAGTIASLIASGRRIV